MISLKNIIVKRVTLVVAIIVYLILSFFHLKSIYYNTINEASDQAMHNAETIESSINTEDVLKLTASEDELLKSNYQNIKKILIGIREINTNARFVYFLKYSDNKFYFLADSEPVNSVDYSAPGDEYFNESDQEIYVPFKTGNPIVTQPTTDQWGTWISVLIPVKDEKTGAVNVILGMDYNADMWISNARKAVAQSVIMLLAVLLFTISVFYIVRKNINLRNTIIQLIETEKELVKSKELAEAASVAKSSFLSNMSHEIRTPLNGVIGFTELLRNTPLNKNQKDYLENAIISANSLMGVINDILDFSKIESGKMELEQVKTDVYALLENAADIVKIMAAKKGLELLLNVQPGLPRYIFIDPVRTKQILINLLSNAVKFTHAGEVELKVGFEQISSKKGKVCISVRDTGIGIKEADKKKLFKAFSQADTSTTRRYGGTGLGLIISNSLAEKMGSKIEFESTLGIGTTFSFCFDTGYELADELKDEKTELVKSVLVIDDNENNRTILEHTLRHWGVEYTGAESGFEALKCLETNKIFDLIIVDYHMPELNGIDTIKLIREKLAGVNDEQSILMLHSSSDNDELHTEAKELNVKYMLTKPIKQDELYYYLCNLNSDINTNSGAEKSSSEVNTPNQDSIKKSEIAFKILVAEDTQMNMLVISNMLKNILPKMEMTEANNGLEAINVLKKKLFDIVLMDVQMPEMDGITATKKIRMLKNGASVPVIALTAGVSKEEREACFNAGMNDFLAKPIDAEELNRVLNKYLFGVKVKKQISKSEVTTKNAIHFDRKKLLAKIGNDDTMNTILVMSRMEYPNYLAEIEKSIVLNDPDLIKRAAHKLKGSAFNMEFTLLGEIAAAIEKNNENPQKLSSLLTELKLEWDNVLININ